MTGQNRGSAAAGARPTLLAEIEDDQRTRFSAVVSLDDLEAVTARVMWAAVHLDCPSIEAIQIGEPAATAARIVFDVVEGTPADRAEHRFEPNATMRLVGEAARHLHNTVIADCPVGASLAARAQAVVAAASPHDPPLAPPYHRVTTEKLAEMVAAGVPDDPDDPVVCHGALDLTSIVIHQGERATLAPPIGLTVGDRHLDLATLVRSLSETSPGEFIPAMLESYGWDAVAAPRMDWFDMLAALETLDRTDATDTDTGSAIDIDTDTDTDREAAAVTRSGEPAEPNVSRETSEPAETNSYVSSEPGNPGKTSREANEANIDTGGLSDDPTQANEAGA